jgi:NAD(P)-dependent dehydrogenase (short-subunit alcohol dehydrogenase family)
MSIQAFEGKTAVITGAASGIGRALAGALAASGARLVLADMDEAGVSAAARELAASGAETLAVRCDVSRAAQVEALAGAAYTRFGEVHLLFNNAGVVSPNGACWEKPLDHWEWVIGANLWGIVHGIRSFVPRMLAQNTAAHIVNTASVSGLITMPWAADYFASKHAAVAISEALFMELQALGAPVGVSVLCPGFVRTAILARSREKFGAAARNQEAYEKAIAESTSPSEIAAAVLDAIRANRFYILPHPELMLAAEARWEAIRQGGAPRNVAG